MSHAVVIACGGTGGHLTPGIALAERLAEHGLESLLLTSHKRVDSRLLEKYPSLRTLAVPGTGLEFTPRGILRFASSQASAIRFARRLFKEQRPRAFVSFGGFLTLGPALAGRMAGIPVILHEANRVPGKAVRALSRLATHIWLPPGLELAARPGIVRHAGFPVRREFVKLPRADARRALGIPEAGPLLLVFGGSQGAATLNAWASKNSEQLRASGAHLLCVTGPDAAGCASKESGMGKNDGHSDPASPFLRFIPFCDRMPEALSAADLVLARAGAGSIAEFAACETPSVLVPLPSAADNHQEANARHFSALGGARLVPQGRLQDATGEILRLLHDASALKTMRDALKAASGAFDWRPMLDDIIQIATQSPSDHR
ncbi:MAG: UDP-N-acetylglucosamine--N-acetylmuramyl-(pentapeptide) pyrophosphoryl-undecaprenol N-acetylglucosamine transferase [Puniceicoccales bacterium]|jgi:UDP-N-acetylglucosamine--N-acetylmuramyl-(pentapeptide) pyrophosphoryl-undecaprenol N-acetylglucosamine transferase|nr:UDP-N-acetylglucosamine--N-acetylmuramyl-(pentapeptide) pyrophosphoryl-undecaprenol N-acetylglucosamine transferase [Puniceicoccales bacterium]